ncbi:hypothetical protein TVAG_411080 [Trichomonas vaginalis G3]|uniref:Glycosyltransferase 61 catalytic domain-containing protein n=1 Tax=Trichomonas vaginalis (strain ATCC PRA-98 / G3) TaxID=412133 RepID=A2DXL3_TRIV3|nr:EGF domain-specific O-linked N-acetylglucosamine family [Trichomonas vaginalis G3]EAY14842.1 hypothetical protein TVAG_411080 [Trichomonas vaginalis G3]KAI5541177.1 EGF domain-specific O-linked N-acetylglucosamine family [Trichomonas vaginalis G3]|eukprot:XP_001327065.1 hypothetical protein [Trichomonas vaginalis G3]
MKSNICSISSKVDKFIDTYSMHSLTFKVPILISSVYKICIYTKNYQQKINIYTNTVNCTFSLDEFPFTNYTSIVCFGKSFNERWCVAENACRENLTVVFSFPYNVKFSSPFVNPSARPSPYSRDEFIINSNRIKFLPELPYVENSTAILCSRYLNHRMLWHNLVDFVIPIYRAMHTTNISSDCTIHAFDNDGKYGLFYANALCQNIIHENSNIYCHKRMIIGVPKTGGSQSERKLFLNYDIPRNELIGLRELMLKEANSTGCMPSREHPKVLLIKRRTKEEKRRLINSDEVSKAIHEVCPFCEVLNTDLQDFNKMQQVSFTCSVSLLIGLHGSGLTHLMWQYPSSKEQKTAVIEILPYLYTCRDWYSKLASMAGVEYFSLKTLRKNQSRWEKVSDERERSCHSGSEMCGKGWCHDFLRDQSVIVDIDQFKKLLSSIVENLTKNRL